MHPHQNRRRSLAVFASAICLITGCSGSGVSLGDRATGASSRSTSRPAIDRAGEMIAQIERAHGASAWRAKAALSADLSVELDGKNVLAGTLTFTPDRKRSRIDLSGGATLVYDGQRAWLSPAAAEFEHARFHLLAWPRFIAAPFALRDPATTVTSAGVQPLGSGRSQEALRIVAAAPTPPVVPGGSLLYPMQETGMLRAMSNVATTGDGDDADAPQDAPEPRAVVFDDWVAVDGVTLPTRGTFYAWNPTAGIIGDPIGRFTLKNTQFIAPPPDLFAKPEDAREDRAPVHAASTTATTEPARESGELTTEPAATQATD